jgi:hypothetical protein
MNSALVLRKTVARRLGLATATLARLDRDGKGPGPVIHVSRTSAGYREEDAERFIAARLAKAAAPTPPSGFMRGKGLST